jgi:hypothetical protein
MCQNIRIAADAIYNFGHDVQNIKCYGLQFQRGRGSHRQCLDPRLLLLLLLLLFMLTLLMSLL